MGCNIDKMLIKGIRSFSPDNSNVIEFYKPLTLIVGHNGAGKTTVIECLKMSCTGELPPNTRSGQSFIHDPKISGESEVKAQIKLRFLTSTRQPVIVIRSFQLTQKKTALQYKALDNTLQTVNKTTGQQEALSYRCADIDKVVPAMMGVSKAVLENVIFVHQDDSNWPLAEGQVLKKKFDDIFAATRYTKALEELRKLKTRQGQEAREMKLKLEHLKTHKDHAARLRGEAEEGRKKSEALQQEIDALHARLEELSQEKNTLSAKLMSLADIGDDIKELRAKHDMLVSKNSEVYARLVAAYPAEDLELSLEALESLERDVEPQVDNNAGTIRRLERELNTCKLEGEALKDQYAKEIKSQGRLAAEAEAQARNITERDRFIRKLCLDFGMPGLPGDDGSRPLTFEALTAFRNAFGSRLAAAVDSLTSRRAQHQQEDDERGRVIDKLSAQIGGFGETLRAKQDQMRANENRAMELLNQLDACTGSKDAVDAATAREESCASRLAAKDQELQDISLTGDVERHTVAIQEIQGKAVELRSERERLASAAEQTARMNYKAQELVAAEKKAVETSRRHQGALAVLLGVAPNNIPTADAGLKAQVDAAIATMAEKANVASSAIKALQSRSATVQGALQATQDQLSKAQAEATSLSSRLQTGMLASAGDRVLESVQKLETERKAAQASLQQTETFQAVADRYCAYATSHNACMVCQRKFDSPTQKEAFLHQQETERQKMPTLSARFKQQVATLDQQLANLKELEPIAARHEKLEKEELPSLQLRIAELQSQERSLHAEIEAAVVDDVEASRGLTDARALLQEAVLPMERLFKEIHERRAEVELLRSAISTENASRSVTDVDSELAALEATRATHEHERQQAMNKMNRLRDEISSLRDELHKAKEETMRLKASIERRRQLEKDLSDVNAATDQLAVEMVERRKLQEPLEAQRTELMKEREGKRAQARTLESGLESELRNLQTLETQLETRERAMKDYEESGAAAALEKANNSLAELLRRQQEAEASVATIQDQLVTAKEEATGVEAAMRQVADILAYRRSKAQEEAIANDMDARGAAMTQVGNRDALQGQYRELEAKEQAARSEADRALGALATVNDAAARALGELRHPNYVDVDAKYSKQLIELRTTEMASGDLDKYHKALEKALLSFHTSKMADINAIVKELWQKTYRNTDIDYIQIKADTEGGAARSYNYRVVMSCGGAELDMRGRCSAGQKVLACLIIRLALAETFCLNCGILALDEPTTNLDADNSASLADALRSIMAARREQQNFQLVVITHDESFARQIGTREHAEYMWRIEKDENQHSTILKEEILD